MPLSLDALQVLDSIDRKGSFALAANELHRVPSAITYSVRQLEEGLGVELFDRAGHRAVLTEAGRELLAEVYAQGRGTRLRISHEVLGGVWDALASGRADLGIGASGDAPAGRSFSTRVLGRAEMRFVAAPFHPICGKPTPLSAAAVREH